MQPLPNHPPQLVLVCVRQKNNGRPCCAAVGGEALFDALKAAVAAHNPLVRVSRVQCLGQCGLGPNVVIMPQNLWFSGVAEKDIPTLLSHLSSPRDMISDDDLFLGI